MQKQSCYQPSPIQQVFVECLPGTVLGPGDRLMDRSLALLLAGKQENREKISGNVVSAKTNKAR